MDLTDSSARGPGCPVRPLMGRQPTEAGRCVESAQPAGTVVIIHSMSDETHNDKSNDATSDNAEEAKKNDEGIGLGHDDVANTFEPDEDPEATDGPE